MSTFTDSNLVGTWLKCAKTVTRFSAGLAGAILLVGGLADHWHEVMAVLALGFWINLGCASIGIGVAMVIVCRGYTDATPATEVQALRREAPSLIAAMAIASVAALVVCAQPGDADSVTKWLACAAIRLGAVGAWLFSAISLLVAFSPFDE